MKITNLLLAFLIVILSNLSLYSNQEFFDGEINGNFIYHHDNHNNLLYILSSELKLTKINLENNLSETSQLKVSNKEQPFEYNSNFEDEKLNNILLLFEKTLNNILDDFTLHYLDENLFLIHNGGGVVLQIRKKTISRIDDSFASMQKFGGDIFNYDEKIHHFGGYGFWRTNNTMIKFYNGERQSKQWEEVVSNNNFPNGLNKGITGFSSAIVEENYFILGGMSINNSKDNNNNNLYRYNFNNDTWISLGMINHDRSVDDIILNTKNLFYVFNRSAVHVIDIDKLIQTKYNYSNEFSYNKLSANPRYNFTSHSHKGVKFNDVHVNYICNKNKLFTITQHNSKYGMHNINSYDIKDIIDLDSAKVIPLFAAQRDRNDFFIPILIVVIVVIINLLYKGISRGKKPKNEPLYYFENDELNFLNTKIELDSNSIEILKMLLYNEKITSNDIVARLVENGLSYDYASKVKNKIIESLNEKFKFITNSKTPFISINKSAEDKRIQILEIIKYDKED